MRKYEPKKEEPSLTALCGVAKGNAERSGLAKRVKKLGKNSLYTFEA